MASTIWTIGPARPRSLNRKVLFDHDEDKLTAIRMGPWKVHFSTKENYYSNLTPLTFPLVFNLKAGSLRKLQ